jgi:hypothetical protein
VVFFTSFLAAYEIVKFNKRDIRGMVKHIVKDKYLNTERVLSRDCSNDTNFKIEEYII